ncbi:hypothetical protein [Paraburkholderia sp. MM5384-R2]|uniref:hypothetical protein n=1 Tax=unclassified Paraburkholderia TaxID=2615204 RepID=UPI001616D453|nr:hypothetical protein [Paraburkholderia sp. MM5384-R2]MBB5501645.1 AraC-like DNA-binding protein [Paraburkholderia sp. MM5384-R2]
MNGIDEEMARNGGVYPHNGGAVSAAEVARRAGIHETTFYTAKQRDLGKEVKAWISGLKATNVVGRVRLRRTVAERLQEWMENYKGLAQSHRDTELELQQVEADRDAALVELERLRNENATLRENLSVSAAGRVVGFPPQNR